jgi:DNA-binding MarR family transcriptional regulator
MGRGERLEDADYALLSEFRYELRCFLHFSEAAAQKANLTPQQHQALLSVRGANERRQTVGQLADRLLIKPHSASGLVQRLESQGLIERILDPDDARVVHLQVTARGERILEDLALAHRTELHHMKPMLQALISRLA